jgi:hypothetical protein
MCNPVLERRPYCVRPVHGRSIRITAKGLRPAQDLPDQTDLWEASIHRDDEITVAMDRFKTLTFSPVGQTTSFERRPLSCSRRNRIMRVVSLALLCLVLTVGSALGAFTDPGSLVQPKLADMADTTVKVPVESAPDVAVSGSYGMNCGGDSCCARCDNGCGCGCSSCGCCPMMFPNMIGDGGLIQPSIIVAGSRVFCMQRHASKVYENNSALPQDRFGFMYNGLKDVILGDAATRVSKPVDEYRFMLEKTLFDGNVSVEFLLPFYNTSKYHINNDTEYLEGPQLATEFGDLAFGFKWLVRETERSAWAVGLRIETPTSEDAWIAYWPSQIHDYVWHFTPYVAAQLAPTERTFVNLFGSYRLNSTSTIAQTDTYALSIREAAYLMLDASVGHWLYRDPHDRGLTGLAPVLELHYTTTPTSEPGYLYQGIPATGAYLGHTDYLNLTAGMTAIWNERTSISAGFAFPLRYNDGILGPTDRNYDWAFLLHVNVGIGP